MKKVLALVFVLALFAGQALGGEFNFKGGFDTAGSFGTESSIKGNTGSISVNTGITLNTEYLTSVADILKVGGGASFLLPRETYVFDVPYYTSPSGAITYYDYNILFFFMMPIYGTIQVNPINNPWFLKGNLGLALYFASLLYTPNLGKSTVEDTSGVYFSISSGWEFPFGLVLEAGYEYYDVETKISFDRGGDNNFMLDGYDQIFLKAGYKLKM
jgi:hypothetical protein